MKILLVIGLASLASAMYSPSDDVVELTPTNFNNRVVQSDDVWLIEFYAPWCGHCKSLAPDWKKAATALKGVVRVGAVDASEHQSLGGQYGVKGFPTIKIFGSDKTKPQDYQGARTAQGIVNEALSVVRTVVTDRLAGKKSGGSGSKSGGGNGGGGSKKGSPDDVVELTDANFNELIMNSEEMWLVEFFAPWCGHCKNLAPEWEKAASELKGKVKVAALDATVNSVVANRYGIPMYPTILLFGESGRNLDVYERYEGGLTAQEILAWTLEKYAGRLPGPEIAQVVNKTRQVRGYPTIKYFPAGKKAADSVEEYDGGRTASDIVAWALDKMADSIPAPKVEELTSQSVLSQACDDHQLCVISILPHILDCQSKCRNDYLKVLAEMGEKYKKRMWGWVWAEGGSQTDVEEALGIGGFGYPAMAAVNSRKGKFAILKGAFSDTGINEFLRQLALGRGSTAPMKSSQLPTVMDAQPWDGKDGELPEEEDIDLSDVELDDLDEDSKDEL